MTLSHWCNRPCAGQELASAPCMPPQICKHHEAACIAAEARAMTRSLTDRPAIMWLGWEYAGELTQGSTRPCLDDPALDLGAMWECPFFAELQDLEAPSTITHILCVSPYPHHLKDRPTNPCLYWLGDFQGQRFDLESAHGTANTFFCSCCHRGDSWPIMGHRWPPAAVILQPITRSVLVLDADWLCADSAHGCYPIMCCLVMQPGEKTPQQNGQNTDSHRSRATATSNE